MTMTHRVGAWVAAVVLAVTGGFGATTAAQERPAASSAAPQDVKTADGFGHGIKVHGRWTIEVRNPDGSLVSRQEFDNALVRHSQLGGGAHVFGGDRALTNFVMGFPMESNWRIVLADSIDENTNSWFVGGACDGVCRMAVTKGFSPNQDAQLTGSVTVGQTAGQDGRRIGVVGTEIVDSGTGVYIFSTRVLSQPVTIAPGQIVQVKVVFSFS